MGGGGVNCTENVRLSDDRLPATPIIGGDFKTPEINFYLKIYNRDNKVITGYRLIIEVSDYRRTFLDPCTPPIIRQSLYFKASQFS